MTKINEIQKQAEINLSLETSSLNLVSVFLNKNIYISLLKHVKGG